MNKKIYTVKQIFEELFYRYPSLEICKDSIKDCYSLIEASMKAGGVLYSAGNGGSASDSEHIVGELMKSFNFKRQIPKHLSENLSKYGVLGKKLLNSLEGGLPAISLPSLMSLSTAIINDTEAENIYAQMLVGLGKPKDVFLGISTSGNSENIIRAAILAKAKGMKVIGLCGEKTALLDIYSDVVIHVPETETYKIQELHLPIYHALCAMLESNFFSENNQIEVIESCI